MSSRGEDGQFQAYRLYTPREIEKAAHAPRGLIYASLEDGSLRAIRRGRRWWVPGAAVLEWIGALGID